MGRLIDADKLIDYLLTPPWNVGWDDEIEIINNQPTVEAIPKADYEQRLKADMVAMLTELQLEIEEIDSRAGYDGNGMPTFVNDYVRIIKVNEIIQQKINSLKEDSDVC